MARRNNIDICADILRVAQVGAKKTRIVYRANLNFKILKNYLKMLKENGLLKNEDGFYITTSKGAQFLEQYNGIISF